MIEVYTPAQILDAAEAAIYAAEDRAYRAGLTPEALRNYRLWIGEIVERCSHCGRVDAQVEHDGGPDMVGSWWSTTCSHCGTVIESGSDGLEMVR